MLLHPPMLSLLIALAAPARAARPPEDYRTELHGAAARQMDSLNQAGRYEDARALGERTRDTVGPGSAVAYELGYACNLMGDRDQAMRWYDEAVELDPTSAWARYDRGELLLIAGSNERARQDFAAASDRMPDHWAPRFRLAHLAAARGDVPAFEDHLTQALRHDFNPALITADPDWRRWAVDPELGSVMTRLFTIFGKEDHLQTLRGAPSSPASSR